MAFFPLLILAILVGFVPTSPLELVAPALAQTSDPATPEPVILSDEQEEYPLGLNLEILEDPSGKLTIEEVSSPEFVSQFSPSQSAVPNFGFTESAYWVRLHLDNQSQKINEWLLEVDFANMYYVDLYTPMADGAGFAVKQSGNLKPVSTRDILYPKIVFKMVVPIQSQQTYYLRFQNGASMTLGLTVWTQEAFLGESQLKLVLHGLFFGALMALLVYHVFLLITLKETIYLYFVCMLVGLFLSMLSYDGMDVYLLANLYEYRTLYFALSFTLLIASMLLFSDAFLDLKTRFPKIHRLNFVFLAIWGGLAFLTPFISPHQVSILMAPWALVTLVSVLAIGIASWFQGYRPAIFIMIAWIGMLSGTILVLLLRMGIIPSTPLSENAFYLGVLWMAVCWSVALADRINYLKAETEGANRNLRNSEYRLSQILEGLPIGVLLYGKDQRPKYTNQRTHEIFNDPAKGTRVDLSAGRTLAQAI